jgi:hypothetical protein
MLSSREINFLHSIEHHVARARLAMTNIDTFLLQVHPQFLTLTLWQK